MMREAQEARRLEVWLSRKERAAGMSSQIREMVTSAEIREVTTPTKEVPCQLDPLRKTVASKRVTLATVLIGECEQVSTQVLRPRRMSRRDGRRRRTKS